MEGEPLKPSFGDNVRIRRTRETESGGFAGLEGQIYGETTPSVTGVDVIGELREDYALNVHFDERDDAFWFAAELVEFVDHAPGTEVTIHGVDKHWTRTASGGWEESPIVDKKKRWWKLW